MSNPNGAWRYNQIRPGLEVKQALATNSVTIHDQNGLDRRVQFFHVSGSHPMFNPEFWEAAIDDQDAHITGIILENGTMVISHGCESVAQLREVAQLSMSEMHGTTFELGTVMDARTGLPSRLLAITIDDTQKAPTHNGRLLISSLISQGIGLDLQVQATLLRRADADEVAQQGIWIPETVYAGPLSNGLLSERLESLGQPIQAAGHVAVGATLRHTV